MKSIKYCIILAIAKNPEGFPEIALIEPTAPIRPLYLFLIKNTSYLK